jgi:hypothetical protein
MLDVAASRPKPDTQIPAAHARGRGPPADRRPPELPADRRPPTFQASLAGRPKLARCRGPPITAERLDFDRRPIARQVLAGQGPHGAVARR